MRNNTSPCIVPIETIIIAIENKYGVKIDELKEVDKSESASLPRHMLCYLAYYYTELSYKEVGYLVDRDHSTAMSSCSVIKVKMKACEDLGGFVHHIENSGVIID